MTLIQQASDDSTCAQLEGHSLRETLVPRLPQAYVPRYRLWGQLDLVTRSAVTVVVAPEGSGKTLGVAGWVEKHRRQTATGIGPDAAPRTIWVTVDPSWNDERLGELLDCSTNGSDPGRMGPAHLQRPLIVIDDAHRLPQSALKLIERRLDLAPDALNLLLLSRWDLLMGNLAHQLLGNLTTLRGELLRLDDLEAEALIRYHAQTDDLAMIQAIQSRAGGWCAVVVLAARSARALTTSRVAWLHSVPDRVQSVDRVVTEVFSALSHRERHLLLCVAPDGITTVENAARLSKDDQAAEILETLESTGLLVTRLSPDSDSSASETRYRIHPLLAEVVRRRLSAGGVDVEQAQATVVRAVRLDVDRGDVAGAFDRLVAIQEVGMAAELLASDGFTIWARGHAEQIRTFAHRFPEVVAEHPGTWFAIAVERWFEGDVAAAQPWMNRMLEAPGDDQRSLLRAACLRLMLARLGAEPADSAAANASRLLTTLQVSAGEPGRENTIELALLCTELGITQNWLGDLVHAESNLRAAIGLCRSRGLPLQAACALSHLAFTEYMSGQEHTARLVAEDALAAAAQSRLPERRYVSARASLILNLCRFVDLPLITTNDVDRTTPIVHPADLCMVFWCQINSARLKLLDGDLDGAARSLDMPLNFPVLSSLPDHLGVASVVERAFVAVLAGDAELIYDLERRLQSSAYIGEAALLGGFRADLQGDRREAARLFNAAADDMTFTHQATRVVAMVCEAQVRDALGDHETAVRRLQLATTETAVRRNAGPFCGWTRQGTPVETLIDKLERGTPTRWEWVEEIATARHSKPDLTSLFASSAATAAERSRTPDGLIIPMLSAREREVLRELARGATYADIGANLFVSENTVKTHVSSLYAKLSASRRSEALAIARSLHLL